MKRTLSTLFGLAVLCLFAEAQAVPSTVSFTGRLSTSTGPVSGSVTVTFKLFDLAMNGTEQWSETRSLTATSTGLVYADLGSMTTLDSSVLDNSPLYLEIHVGAEILTPRLPLQSVPYAIRSEVANSADTLGGVVTASQVVTAANAPLAINTGTASLTTCNNNQIYKMVGGNWTCAADADQNTTYSAAANGGLSFNGTQVGLTTCTTGQVLKSTGAGTWGCAADDDANTTYSATANGGLSFNGTQIGLTTCTTGQVLKSTGAGTWGCAADTDSGGDILGITTSATSGLNGGCTSGTCTLTVDPSDFNAIPQQAGTSGGAAPADSPAWSSTYSDTIVAPSTPGRIVAIGSTEFRCSNTSTSNTSCALRVGLNTSVAAPAFSSRTFYTEDVGSQYASTTVYAVFPVAASTTTTVHLVLQNETAGDSWFIYSPRLLLFFVPD